MGSKGYSETLPYSCQVVRDWQTNKKLPKSKQLTQDKQYTVRAWMAVVTYLLSDYKFLFQ